MRSYYFIVAGKLYPMLESLYPHPDNIAKLISHYSYGITEFAELDSLNLTRIVGRKTRFYRPVVDRSPETFFEQALSPAEVDWLIAQRISVMHTAYDYSTGSQAWDVELRKWRPKYKWAIDPFDLKNFGFQRVLDPFQCNQELAMWVGGVLPRNGPPMVEITDDKIKAHKHGMDEWSFRKKGA